MVLKLARHKTSPQPWCGDCVVQRVCRAAFPSHSAFDTLTLRLQPAVLHQPCRTSANAGCFSMANISENSQYPQGLRRLQCWHNPFAGHEGTSLAQQVQTLIIVQLPL